MLSLHTTTSPTALLAPTPLPGATHSSTDGSGAPSAFARMLQGSQPPAAASAPPASQQPQRSGEQEAAAQRAERPAERHNESKTEHSGEQNRGQSDGQGGGQGVEHPNEAQADAAARGQAPAATSPSANRPAPTGREGARGRDDAKRAQASRTSTAAAQAEAAKRDAATDKKDDLATTPDPALADWLASLKLPEPLQAAQAAALAASTTATAAADPNSPAAPGTPPTHTGTTSGTDAAATAAGQAAVASLASGLPAGAGSPSGDKAAASTGRDRPSDPSVRGTGHHDGQAGDAAGAALTTTTAARPGAGDGQSASNGGGNAGNPPPAWTPVTSTAATAVNVAPAPVTVFTVPAGRSNADPVAVNVPVPVDSPEFPRALGVELSVLARDGIEHAELHLSPAEMGPVSVQISVDGSQARIDFGADVASTRQAIEAGLPELASALRDAGLTLTGGGVSQHSRERSDAGERSGAGNGGFPGQGRGNSGDNDLAPPPTRRFVRAGGVDMYA